MHHSVNREDFPDKAQRNMIVFQKNAETLVNAHKRLLCCVTAAWSCLSGNIVFYWIGAFFLCLDIYRHHINVLLSLSLLFIAD